jgi:hypothetical protein
MGRRKQGQEIVEQAVKELRSLGGRGDGLTYCAACNAKLSKRGGDNHKCSQQFTRKYDDESGCDLDGVIDGDVDDLELSGEIYDHAADEQFDRPVSERLAEGYEMIGGVDEEMPEGRGDWR